MVLAGPGAALPESDPDVNPRRQHYRGRNPARAQNIAELRTMARSGVVTLVYSAHDEAHNDAVVLQEFLLSA